VRQAIARPQQTTANASGDHVMRGADSVSLIARLPWWRSNNMQTIHYARDKLADSKVLAAADAWISQYGPSDAIIVEDGFRIAQTSAIEDSSGIRRTIEDVEIADAAEPNAIDLAAENSRPPEKTFLHSLLAILGGAFAAASAARFLFV
jgi:hypothetical protein